MPHDDFAAGYHESHPDPAGRARHYAAAHAEGFDPGTLDPDDHDAVAEDLAELPHAELAGHVAGTDPDGHDGALARKAAARVAARHTPFDLSHAGSDEERNTLHPHHLAYVHPDWRAEGAAAPSAHLAHVDALLSLAKPVAGKLPPGHRLLNKHSAVYEAAVASGLVDHAHTRWEMDDDAHRQELFDSITSPPTVGAHDAPKGAADTGSVSGANRAVADPGEFDPSAVDVHKRLNRDWHVVRRGDASANNLGRSYEFVHRKDVPQQVRLPEAYWAGKDAAAPPFLDDDAQARNTRHSHPTDDAGPAGRKELAREAAHGKTLAGRVAVLKERHAALANRGKSLTAHAAHADRVGQDFAEHLDGTADDIGDGSVHTHAVRRLGEAIGRLKEHTDAGVPDAPDFDLDHDPSLSGHGDVYSSRSEHHDALHDAHADFDDREATQAEALHGHEAELHTHAHRVGRAWGAVHRAASAVVRTAHPVETEAHTPAVEGDESTTPAAAAGRIAAAAANRAAKAGFPVEGTKPAVGAKPSAQPQPRTPSTSRPTPAPGQE